MKLRDTAPDQSSTFLLGTQVRPAGESEETGLPRASESARADAAEARPVRLPDFPARPLPPGLARRARQAALRMRAVRAAVVLVVGAVLAGSITYAAAPPSPREARPPDPVPAPDDPLPFVYLPPAPRTNVGLGANTWVQQLGWCVGDIPVEGGTGTVDACRFLPTPGTLDVAVLQPGRFAPQGYSLVIAIAADRGASNGKVRATLTDGAGTGDMTIVRPMGSPSMLFAWAFTRGGTVSVTVYDTNGSILATCAQCGGPAPVG